MRQKCFTMPDRVVAALMTGLLFAILSIPLQAQPTVQSHPGHGFGPAYDAKRETTLEGTIQRVVTKHVAGTPAGMHLMVVGPQGLVDAHLGSFLSKETTKSLQAGTSVHIVGAMSVVHGKSYLLARQVTVGDHTFTVRSAHGVVAPGHNADSSRPAVRRTSKTESNGGAR